MAGPSASEMLVGVLVLVLILVDGYFRKIVFDIGGIDHGRYIGAHHPISTSDLEPDFDVDVVGPEIGHVQALELVLPIAKMTAPTFCELKVGCFNVIELSVVGAHAHAASE
ncbi:hypothetical protein IB228_18900 [Pseudoxanthomonas sp. PXM04]|nr:hypothetical protein [Pseudoxanthomonas sp. PXM04]